MALVTASEPAKAHPRSGIGGPLPRGSRPCRVVGWVPVGDWTQRQESCLERHATERDSRVTLSQAMRVHQSWPSAGVGLFGSAALNVRYTPHKAKYWHETDSEQVEWSKDAKNFEKRVKSTWNCGVVRDGNPSTTGRRFGQPARAGVRLNLSPEQPELVYPPTGFGWAPLSLLGGVAGVSFGVLHLVGVRLAGE